MVNFKFSSGGRKCIRQILQAYQSGTGRERLLIQQYTTSIIEYIENLIEGESVGFTVKSMEKDFPISNYPLEQTEFLYDSKQGMIIKNKTLISHGQ